MQLSCQTIASLNAVPEAAWDRLVPAGNPFLRHAFLVALEDSHSVGTPQTGWVPAHLLVWADDLLVGAMPLYEKFDSYGEYIFDWAWAQAAYQAGISYYPKLVSAVPFTPAGSARLLWDHKADAALQAAITTALFGALHAHAERCQASSIHLLFVDAAQMQLACAHGFAARLSHQFHWHAEAPWRHFDDYLGAMRASARKQVKKERAQAAASGLALTMRPASSLSASDWQAMYVFYRHTVYEKGAQAYLSPAFFEQLARTMGEEVWVAMAHRDDTPVAGALFLTAGTQLFGRYWGCLEQYDALHFELCYYMPIDWALARGITRFEAGAQGEHKLKRGFLPSLCHSAHWLRHPGLRQGVERFLEAERAHVQAHVAALAAHTPFHRPHTNS